MEITTETNETFKRQIILFSIQLDLKKKKTLNDYLLQLYHGPILFGFFSILLIV